MNVHRKGINESASYVKLFRIKEMLEDDNSLVFHPLRSISSSFTPVKKSERKEGREREREREKEREREVGLEAHKS